MGHKKESGLSNRAEDLQYKMTCSYVQILSLVTVFKGGGLVAFLEGKQGWKRVKLTGYANNLATKL